MPRANFSRVSNMFDGSSRVREAQGANDICGVNLSLYQTGTYAWPRWESNLRHSECQQIALLTERSGRFAIQSNSFDINVIFNIIRSSMCSSVDIALGQNSKG